MSKHPLRDRSYSAPVVDQVCRFFVQDKCLRGDLCTFSHDLTQSVGGGDDSSVLPCADCTDNNLATCSICLQHIHVEGKRFGLLPRCNHLFCLECILSWRAKSAQCPSTRSGAKQCPVCRIPSYFVIPSGRFYIGEFKKRRAVEYLNFLALKPCRYYSESAKTDLCPYGDYCFFHHCNSKTIPVGEEKLRLVFTDGTASSISN
jgi:E3 ubiquitin-protein ligase makorin